MIRRHAAIGAGFGPEKTRSAHMRGRETISRARRQMPALVAAASALRAGVNPEALKRLRESRQAQSLTVPLAVLGDLVARGVPADTASVYVLTIIHSSDEQLAAFQRSVERDIALGAPPFTAAAVRVNGIADYNRPTGGGTYQETPRAPQPPRRP